MTGGFTVNAAALAQAGREITGQSTDIQAIQQQINKAEVPTKAWGELGMTLGLYPAYLGLLASLEANMKQMGAHLDQTGNALASVAQAYQDIEDGFAKAFADLQDGFSGVLSESLKKRALGAIGVPASKSMDYNEYANALDDLGQTVGYLKTGADTAKKIVQLGTGIAKAVDDSIVPGGQTAAKEAREHDDGGAADGGS